MKSKNILSVFGFAILGAIILICTNGMTFTGITIFDESLIEEFSWTKSTLKFRDFINLACAALIMPFIGAIIDKYGVRKTFSFGLILLSICYFVYGNIGSAFQMYLIHIGFAFAVASAGTLAVIIMVSERTQKNRGLAIGIALAGTSAGGIIIPIIASKLLDHYEWRSAFQLEAIIPLLMLVLVLLFVRSKDKFTDGEKKTSDLTEINFQEALRSRTFWFLAIIGVFCYYAILGTMGNLFLYMRELDFTRETAAKSLGMMSFIILGAKFLSGFLTDYINKFTMFKVQVFIMFLGAMFFALYNETAVWIGIPILALGWGGLYTLINYIIITTFGVESAGKIGGSISFFESLGAGLGIWLSGLIADQSGSYAMSFQVVAILLFLAFLISLFLRPMSPNES